MIGSLSLLLVATALAPRQDAPVRISLNSDGRYQLGDRAKLHVRSEADGYLVVLRTDVNGWVRVVYPTDPGANNFVHRGEDVEIRGPQGRDAFAAGLTEGVGTIVAARAHDSFHFDQFMVDGHWNYRALDSLRAGRDEGENTLVGIVQQMAGDVPFDYDVAQYSVTDPEAYGRYAGAGPYPAYPYAGYPPPYYYYDPFYYAWNPWYYGPFFSAYCFGCFPRFGFGVTFVRPFRPYFPGRVGRPFTPYRPRGAETGARAPAPRYSAPAPRGGQPGRRYDAAPGARAPGGRRVAEMRAAPARGGGGGRAAVARSNGGGGGGGRSGGGGRRR